MFPSLQDREKDTAILESPDLRSRPGHAPGSLSAPGGKGHHLPSLLSPVQGGRPTGASSQPPASLTHALLNPRGHSVARRALRSALGVTGGAVRRAAWGRWPGHIRPPRLRLGRPGVLWLGRPTPEAPGGESLRLIA